MQTDVHYYGTYSIARAAGLNKQTCLQIAYSAQFVDDHTEASELITEQETVLPVAPTAKHITDLEELEQKDIIQSWVPFHLLPAASGKLESEKLICGKDSAVAREMLEHYLSFPASSLLPYLIGVAVHAYTDTFSHYGFSALPVDSAKVLGKSYEFKEPDTGKIRDYMPSKLSPFWLPVAARAAARISEGLEHGAAHLYADRPFLNWRIVYGDDSKSEWRNNPETYLEACEKLHEYFKKFGRAFPEFKESNGSSFGIIKDVIANILSKVDKLPGRINEWHEHALSGALFGGEEMIPHYAAKRWKEQLTSVDDVIYSPKDSHMEVANFLHAVTVHRAYVLDELLPGHGLSLKVLYEKG